MDFETKYLLILYIFLLLYDSENNTLFYTKTLHFECLNEFTLFKYLVGKK